MGTKRVGLARIEALMENLKREIVGFNVENTANSVTAVTAAGALARNSVNLLNDADNATYTLPAAADCARGDIIIVKYMAAITVGQKHSYGTAGEFFSTASTVYKPGGAPGVYAVVTAADGTDDDFLALTGATNAGPGIGTELRFHFDGSKWVVNGKVETTGNGTGTSSVAFAETA